MKFSVQARVEWRSRKRNLTPAPRLRRGPCLAHRFSPVVLPSVRLSASAQVAVAGRRRSPDRCAPPHGPARAGHHVGDDGGRGHQRQHVGRAGIVHAPVHPDRRSVPAAAERAVAGAVVPQPLSPPGRRQRLPRGRSRRGVRRSGRRVAGRVQVVRLRRDVDVHAAARSPAGYERGGHGLPDQGAGGRRRRHRARRHERAVLLQRHRVQPRRRRGGQGVRRPLHRQQQQGQRRLDSVSGHHADRPRHVGTVPRQAVGRDGHRARPGHVLDQRSNRAGRPGLHHLQHVPRLRQQRSDPDQLLAVAQLRRDLVEPDQAERALRAEPGHQHRGGSGHRLHLRHVARVRRRRRRHQPQRHPDRALDRRRPVVHPGAAHRARRLQPAAVRSGVVAAHVPDQRLSDHRGGPGRGRWPDGRRARPRLRRVVGARLRHPAARATRASSSPRPSTA